MRVSDAFQAIVEFEPIAIWVRKFCVKISQSEAFALRRYKKRDTRQSNRLAKESGERGRGFECKAGGASGVAAEGCFGFQTSPVDFKQIWSDDLPYLVAVRGGGSMSYEIIGIPGSDLFKHHSVWSPAASSITVASGFPNILLNVFEAVRKRPSARAPDRPSSTR